MKNINKISLILFFTLLILNSQWLEFLFISSLMSERIASYLFLGLLINLNKIKEYENKYTYFSFILFSFVYLTKQFFSFLMLVVFLYYLLNKKWSKYSFLILFSYLLRELSHLTYFKNVPKDHHISQINVADTVLDIILFRDLKLENVTRILQNLFLDIPSSYLILIFFTISYIYFVLMKEFNKFSTALFLLSLLNFLMVFLLYISVWQNMELESPIRYFYSFIPIFLVTIFLNIDKLNNFYKNKI